jgi:hypothetical protein
VARVSIGRVAYRGIRIVPSSRRSQNPPLEGGFVFGPVFARRRGLPALERFRTAPMRLRPWTRWLVTRKRSSSAASDGLHAYR